MADDYSWVDRGLAKLGFVLDMVERDLPISCRRGNGSIVTVAKLMADIPSVLSAPMTGVQSGKDKHGEWAAEIGIYPGLPVACQKTTIKGVKGFSRDDYAKLLVDDAMIDVARLWDVTFVEGGFEYIITKDGRTFKTGEESTKDIPIQDIAKVMRWVFKAPGIASREIVSVYVTVSTERELLVAYLPVKGEKLPISSRVRGRLLLPCLDRAIFDSDGSSSTFEHLATASLGGWFPDFFMRTSFIKKKFLEGACEEAENFKALLSKKGPVGEKFIQIPRRDGTQL